VLAAAMRPKITRADLSDRITAILDTLAATGANLAVHSAADVLEEATEPLETRGIIVATEGRYRVRDRNVLRYYGRSIQHLLTPAGTTH
jgi:porphobilinogen deaminase